MARPRTSPIWITPKEEFARIVQESKTYTEVLAQFGLVNKGNNSVTLKKRIKEDGLDTSHFDSTAAKIRNLHTRVSLEDVMVENSTFSRTHLRRRIIKEEVIPYECRGCGNKGEWQGNPLSLHLEHINGISNDHRKDNLCFLCPNCHSQTDTYAGRNSKK